jgi:hypothetical protein
MVDDAEIGAGPLIDASRQFTMPRVEEWPGEEAFVGH